MAGGTKQTAQYDPEMQALNRLIMGEVEPSLRGAGGLPGLTRFRPGAVPGAQERGIMEQMVGLGTAPVDAPGFFQEQFRRFLPEVTQGLQGAFEQTAVPSITNYLTASGMGRSGAVGEAIGQAGAQFVQPAIMEASRIAGGMPLPGSVELERLPGALQAAAAPREAQLTEESQLRDMLMSFLFGQQPRSSFAGITGRTKPDYLGMLLQAAGSGAMAFGTAPAGSLIGPPK